MTTYPFVQARYDFGLRKGPTLGLMFHGAEATSGVVGYLSREPARNVSANFVCERSGRMVRMLNVNNASGSLNPNDRSTDKAYFGASHLKAVLGSWWTDPNSAVISVEIEMYAREGPNIAQVATLIDWSKDMVSRFPTIRGALGHADQTDTKRCPGTTTNMKLVFSSIGGHGLWTEPEEEPVLLYRILAPAVGTVTVAVDNADLVTPDGRRVPAPKGSVRDCYARVELLEPLDANPGDRKSAWLIGKLPTEPVNAEAALLLAYAGTFTPATTDTQHKVALAVNGVIRPESEVVV